MSKDFKPLNVGDFDLSPKDMKILVEGAQKFFPPEPEEAPLPAEAEKEPDGSQT